MHNNSSERSTTRRTGSGGAAVTMVARCDLALIELHQIKVADMSGGAMIHRQIEHLVEVAVVEGTIPTHGDCVAAHDTGRGSGVEGVGQSLHILFVVAALQEKLKKPADRHVGDRIKVVELDAMTSPEFFSKLRFDRLLPGREEGSYRIADQVQGKTTIGTAIPECIQELQGLDGLLKDSFTPDRKSVV